MGQRWLPPSWIFRKDHLLWNFWMQRWYLIFHAPVPYLALTKFLLTTMQHYLKSFAIWIRPTWGNLDELVLRLEELSVLQKSVLFRRFCWLHVLSSVRLWVELTGSLTDLCYLSLRYVLESGVERTLEVLITWTSNQIWQWPSKTHSTKRPLR